MQPQPQLLGRLRQDGLSPEVLGQPEQYSKKRGRKREEEGRESQKDLAVAGLLLRQDCSLLNRLMSVSQPPDAS